MYFNNSSNEQGNQDLPEKNISEKNVSGEDLATQLGWSKQYLNNISCGRFRQKNIRNMEEERKKKRKKETAQQSMAKEAAICIFVS